MSLASGASRIYSATTSKVFPARGLTVLSALAYTRLRRGSRGCPSIVERSYTSAHREKGARGG